MKYFSVFLLALTLTACTPITPEEIEKSAIDEQVKVKKKIDTLNEQLHICDNNGGMADIVHGRHGSRVDCKNGVSKDFDD